MVELNAAEIDEVNGGLIQFLLTAIVVYDAVTDFAEGFQEGYKRASSK
ncbi:hypothetical protein [Massilia sp. DD77]